MVCQAKRRQFALAAAAVVGICVAAPAQAAPRRDACAVAREYIRLTDVHQYDRIGDLWAEDAVFEAPNGLIIRGRTAIRAFYAAFLRKITPVNRIASLTRDPVTNRCAMEIETRTMRGPSGEWVPDASAEFHKTAIDLFTVNRQGKIQGMKVYLAPPPRE